MMIYPSSLDIPKIMTFKDSSEIKYFVAKQSDFKDETELKEYLVGKNISVSEQIEEKYIRHYTVIPKKKDCICSISDKECYAFANKGRGAIKVFAIRRRVLNND